MTRFRVWLSLCFCLGVCAATLPRAPQIEPFVAAARDGATVTAAQPGRTFTYQYASSSGDAVAQANQMGAQGFAYYALTGGGNLYVKDSAHNGTYSYRAGTTDTLAQMNEFGAQGFALYITFFGGSLYVKDSARSGTYTYRQLPRSSSAEETLAQMNEQGAQGYEFYLPLSNGNLYVKDSAQSGTFSYALPLAPNSAAGMLAQLNEQGAQGYALLSRFAFVSQLSLGGIRNILVRNSSELGPYSFAVLRADSSDAANLPQFNEKGAEGFRYLITLSLGGLQNIYMKSGAATGCSVTLAPSSQTFHATGGNGMVNVIAPDSCAWMATSSAAWLTVTANANGSGNKMVSYTLAANTNPTQRNATLRVGEQALTITQAGASATVSAASYAASALASEMIAAVFGADLAVTSQAAITLPLPTTLAGTTVKIKDSAGSEQPAPLFFVSPGQVNYLIPAGISLGDATVMITSGSGGVASGVIRIERIAPGLFAANANGQGGVSGLALRVKADGTQSYEALAQYDAAQNRFVAAPLDLGPVTDQVFLILYGTGWRARSGLAAVTARAGGSDCETLYAGAQGDFAGLDQLNLRVPRALAGRGEVELVVTVDGRLANTVRFHIR